MDWQSAPKGKLSSWETAKAVAYEEVLTAMEKHQGQSCWQMLGQGRAEFTATQLTVAGGGRPSSRAVKKLWAKVKHDGGWAPGTRPRANYGRPPQISDAQKKAIAKKAMELKRELIAPTPERVRICLPRLTINRETQRRISDYSIRGVFQTMCYDDKEDDPWQFLPSPHQDCLTDEMKPGRVKTAQHILDHVTKGAAWNFVAIDPCFSLLPKHQFKADQMKIAAMGNRKWMSKKSSRKGANLRAPKTTKTQKDACAVVPWTPIFARGRLKLVHPAG